MYNPFRHNCVQQPFLSPLGKQKWSLPAIALPLTVIIIGGIALVAASSILFSGIAIKTDPVDSAVAAVPSVEDQAPAAAPQVPASSLSQSPTTSPLQDPLLGPSLDEGQPVQTAALPPAPAVAPSEPELLSFNAPVASNEADIAILEVIQMPSAEEDEAEPVVMTSDEPEAPQAVAQAPAAAAKATSGLRSAVTNGAVNMRASPDKNAPVLLVVPANTAIETQSGCSWCAVTYQGNQGYIYKSFINYR